MNGGQNLGTTAGAYDWIPNIEAAPVYHQLKLYQPIDSLGNPGMGPGDKGS